MATGSKRVVYAALIGNGLISVTKFFAAAYTGSSAMLSEGIHSLVDTGNQVLLLHGMRKAKQPADEKHPFGYGAELYFWAFVVAILIFAVGAGVSIYEGIQKVIHPHPVTSPIINYIVLSLAMIFEAGACYVAIKEFKRVKGDLSFMEAVRQSKDPAMFTVLFEDAAAMAGLIVAMVGLVLAQYLGLAWLDGAASIMIGLILAITAIFLAYETKGLIIGESASSAMLESIRGIVKMMPTVNFVNELRTLHQGPEDVLLALSIDFQDGLSIEEVENSVFKLEKTIKEEFPVVKRLFIEVQSQQHHNEMVKDY